MADIYRVADRVRAQVARHDANVAATLVDSYAIAVARIVPQISDLADQMDAYLADHPGQKIPLAWLNRSQRLETLQAQLRQEMTKWAMVASTTVSSAQEAAVGQAQAAAEEMIRAQLEPDENGVALTLDRANTNALTSLVGTLADGSPLQSLLGELAGPAIQQVRQALTTGLLMGESPRVIARRVKGSLGVPLSRALRISRTEILRSYREANRAVYLANEDVVKGWTWHAARTTRTCAACWVMHGSFHPLSERFGGHVMCRCAPVPITKTWRELGAGAGLQETSYRPVPGPVEFDRLDRAEQLAILGPKRFQALLAGQFGLRDLVTAKTSKAWGTSHVETPLHQLLGGHQGPVQRYDVPVGRQPRRVATGKIVAPPPAPTTTANVWDTPFEPAGSLSAARSYATALGVQDVNYHAHLAVANLVNEGIHQLRASGYPAPRAVDISVPGVRSSKRALAHYAPGIDRIQVFGGKQWWSKAVQRSEYAAKSGFWSEGSRTHVIRHEMGHELHFKNMTRQDWMADRWTADDRALANGDRVKAGVSKYGATNRMEFVAEVFGGLTAGMTFPDDIMALYKKLKGPLP